MGTYGYARFRPRILLHRRQIIESRRQTRTPFLRCPYVRIHSFPSPGCSISSSSFSARGHEPRNNPARRGVAFRNCREKFTEKLRRDSYTWGSRCADLRRSESYRRKESSGSNYNRAITRDIFPRESGQIIPH